ncbi:transcription initiation factor TFIID subunit 6 [[Candida] anglica]|uniref:Transcription initiation factor TFIID subunit 6 n=1 Tax=[Candida] anglica TaxID=148631 RepID=A0ABP0EAJ4_9ASCO
MEASSKVPLSHTLWSPHDTVKDAAESLGINLPEEAAKNLAMDVEYRIHEILETANKFMRHGKRKLLTTGDISLALKMLNIEPLYGYDNSQPLEFKEALVGAGGQTLYYIDDHEIEFEKLINQSLPRVPRQTSFTAHWLAIEGVQPMISQNPLPSEIKALAPIVRGATSTLLGDSIGGSSSSSNGTANGAANSSGGSGANGTGAGGSNATNRSSGASTSGTSGTSGTKVEVKPLVKHVLSKQLQLYFDKVVEVLISTDPEKEQLKYAALTSLRNDPGLHQLVPYLIQFVAEQITNQLRNINILSTMLEVISALVENKTIFLDPYVHALMPCILTLLLAKRIGPNVANGGSSAAVSKAENVKSSDAMEVDDEDKTTSSNEKSSTKDTDSDSLLQQLAVREFAAVLLHHIIRVYGSSYTTLMPRVTRTLLRALLDASKPVGTHYGALLGLQNMGSEVIKLVLIGNLKMWCNSVISNGRSEQEREILLNTTLDTLRKLKNVSEDGQESTEEGTGLSDEVKEKLVERLGETLSDLVLEQEDSLEIVRGIFFGELNV